MDSRQTSDEESLAEEALAGHGNAQNETAAPNGGSSSRRAHAPRVGADAFLALLARLEGKSGKEEAETRADSDAGT